MSIPKTIQLPDSCLAMSFVLDGQRYVWASDLPVDDPATIQAIVRGMQDRLALVLREHEVLRARTMES